MFVLFNPVKIKTYPFIQTSRSPTASYKKRLSGESFAKSQIVKCLKKLTVDKYLP